MADLQSARGSPPQKKIIKNTTQVDMCMWKNNVRFLNVWKLALN